MTIEFLKKQLSKTTLMTSKHSYERWCPEDYEEN